MFSLNLYIWIIKLRKQTIEKSGFDKQSKILDLVFAWNPVYFEYIGTFWIAVDHTQKQILFFNGLLLYCFKIKIWKLNFSFEHITEKCANYIGTNLWKLKCENWT